MAIEFYQVNTVVLKALRLYGPVIELFRKASEEMKLGNLMIPKNTCISIPIVKIHRDKRYWGEDANEFNSLRFVNGISKAAKHPNALITFGLGPRTCIGQNFAMLEANTVIALILQRFSLSISSDYKHSSGNHLALLPQYGLPILLKPLCLQYTFNFNIFTSSISSIDLETIMGFICYIGLSFVRNVFAIHLQLPYSGSNMPKECNVMT